jgi:hypothetical protein
MFFPDIARELGNLAKRDALFRLWWRSGTLANAMLAISRALRMRVKDADRDVQLLVDDSHGLCEIRVVRDDDELVAIVAKGVDKHVCCDVDVGAFLFHLHDLNRSGTANWWIGKSHARFALQKMAIVNGEVRDRFERANEELLPARGVVVGGRRFNERSEIANPVDAKARENF